MTYVVLFCFHFLTGAKTEEVALMNGLTVNLHLLLVRHSHFPPHALLELLHARIPVFQERVKKSEMV